MYKTSGQLKKEVKETLKGRWGEAVLLNLVPSILQLVSFFLLALMISAVILVASIFVTSSDSFTEVGSGISSNSLTFDEEFDDLFDSDGGSVPTLASSPSAAISAATSSAGASPFLTLVFTFIAIGISFTFLDVIRKKEGQTMGFKDAFRVFNSNDFIPVFLINLLTYLFQKFWAILFIIPGIVKGYSYSQSNFIYKDLSTHKDVRGMGATSFITESRNLMRGHKARLFLLDLSFIGWYILVMCTFGIALLWVNPYVNATKAAFYNDLAKDRFLVSEDEVEEEWTSF